MEAGKIILQKETVLNLLCRLCKNVISVAEVIGCQAK
jgi:hypothetical protein